MQIYYAEDKSDQVAVRHIVRPIHEAAKSTYCYLSLGRDLAFANVKKDAKKTQFRKLQSRELCSNRRRLKLMYQQSKYQSEHIFWTYKCRTSITVIIICTNDLFSSVFIEQLLLSKYTEVYRNKVIKNLMPRTLFSLPSTCGTWLADGIHQTTT